MSQADILLKNLTVTAHEHNVIDDDVAFIVDPITRKITTSNPDRFVLVQGDHNSKVFTFKIPRYIEGHDMALCDKVKVLYNNVKANSKDNVFSDGVRELTDLRIVDDNTVACTWTITDNGTEYEGTLHFALLFLCLDGHVVTYRWGTDFYDDVVVLEKIGSEITFQTKRIDIIEQWKVTVKREFSLYIDHTVASDVSVAKGELEETLRADINTRFNAATESLNKQFSDMSNEVNETLETFDETLKTELSEMDETLTAGIEKIDKSIEVFDEILETEITSMDEEIDILKARMDTFTNLPEGSTTGDAEMIDARIGADGKAYDSIGTAVREQFTASNNRISQYEGMKNIRWTYGYLDVSGNVVNHAEGETSDRMKTDYILCDENVTIEYYAETNHDGVFGLVFYDKNKNFISGITNIGEPTDRTVVTPAGTRYIRLGSKVAYLDKTYIRFSYGFYSDKMISLLDTVENVNAEIKLLNEQMTEIPIRFYNGALHDDTGALYVSVNRATTMPTYVSGTYTIKTSDENINLLVYNRNEEGAAESYGSWGTELTFTRTGYISVYVKRLDAESITPTDLAAITASITFVKHPGPQFVKANNFNKYYDKRYAEVYVSPDKGNDNNDGSFYYPFKTVQHAIDSGCKKICLFPGEYKQTIYAENINDLSIYAYNGNSYPTDEPDYRQRPVFTNGVLYSEFVTNDDGIMSFDLAEVPARFKQVFINKTLEPETTSSRPSYNAGLWATHANKYDDYKIKPVLTYDELLVETSTFYYDGTNVYVNTSDDNAIAGYTVVGDLDATMISFVNCNNLTLSGLEVRYAYGINYNIRKCSNVIINHCEAGYAMTGDNVSCNYSDVIFNDCLSYKARNDGFNSHFYGISVFNNCRSVYNYDDGESSHEYCKVIVNGGEYAHNYKGGHSPVNGCQFEAHNDYCHNNAYGYYLIASEGFDLSDSLIKISSSIAIDNTNADIINRLYDVVVWNTIYKSTDLRDGSFTDLSAE